MGVLLSGLEYNSSAFSSELLSGSEYNSSASKEVLMDKPIPVEKQRVSRLYSNNQHWLHALWLDWNSNGYAAQQSSDSESVELHDSVGQGLM
ncbi:MAG: hypothetical protein M1818_004899 [Claussenomyces sp. TS43310]|nr:MAG: hypothetical protein M1818_004899 [Claussenomyces sp. TS43310]